MLDRLEVFPDAWISIDGTIVKDLPTILHVENKYTLVITSNQLKKLRSYSDFNKDVLLQGNVKYSDLDDIVEVKVTVFGLLSSRVEP